MKNFENLAQLILFQKENFNNQKFLNFKENGSWRSFSNQEFFENIFNFACGLREIGVKKGDFFANYSYQNPIWLIVDLGAILAGAITVPIFENISKENLFFQLKDANVSTIFTDDEKFLDENLELKIISYGFENKACINFNKILENGKKARAKYQIQDFLNEINAQDLATIIYTSGSTGTPKGVEITHQNLVSQIKDSGVFFPLKQSDVALSYLPLAHIFERMVMMFYISKGISIYFADDVKNIGNILREVNPSLMTTVPRVLEKVFAKIKENINSSSFLKRKLAQAALNRALLRNGKEKIIDKIYDFLIYRKFRAALGKNMQMIICGGAALSMDLQKFYKNIKINIFCGYGLTESSPVLATNCPANNKIGSVGKNFPSVELKIANDGELLARGPNIMKAYHNLPEKTAQTIIDGYLKTGDLAKIDEEGFVTIIGRKKELFKNSNGKYISPTPIEQKLVQELGFLLGAIVIAESLKFTSALLFVEFELIAKFKEKFKFIGSDEEFLKSEILFNFCQEKIAKINKNLNHWEEVQKFAIISEKISIESGEITPSMKLKREVLESKFKNIIEEFYR
jgi:long-chain acyl-CoA synthetase